MYNVKNVKTWDGMDGGGMTCILCKDKQQIATCLDEGNGGEMIFRWFDHTATKQPMQIQMYGSTRNVQMTPNEAEFYRYVTSLPPVDMGYGLGLSSISMDMFVARLCDEKASQARLKKLCRTKTLAHLPNKQYQDGEWDVFKAKFNELVKNAITSRYGDGVVFANEMI